VPVRVVTDSTAALDSATAADYGIVIVPTRVTLGGINYRDGELPLAELIARFGEGVSTSGPPPGAFSEALADLDDGALVLTVAADLSSTFKSASIASAAVPGDRVRVIDTGTAAGAQALVALKAAGVARSGGSLDEVETAARSAVGSVQLYGALETLDYLVKGGRLNGVVGGLAESLGVRPMFELHGSRIRKLRPAFSRRAALDRLVRLWHKSRVEGARLHVVALHALDLEDAEWLLEQVTAQSDPATALIAEFGAVMVVHTGPGLIGLSWWWEEQD
jgi:DegV family protein with EDD domain